MTSDERFEMKRREKKGKVRVYFKISMHMFFPFQKKINNNKRGG